MKNQSIERIATATLIIGSIIGTYFFSRPNRNGARTRLGRKQQQELDRNLTTPANATFGVVWPIIYAGHVGLGIHQALPSQRNNPRYTQAQPWFRINYALNALFGYFFARDNKASRVGAGLTTIAMLPNALSLYRQLEIGRTPVDEPENTLRKSVSIYTGWLTAASVISVANLLLAAGYRPDPEATRRWTYAVLSATGGLGIAVSERLNDPYYLSPLVAAFGGIAAKQAGKNPGVAGLAAGWALLLSVVIARRLRKESPSSIHSPATLPAAEITQAEPAAELSAQSVARATESTAANPADNAAAAGA